MAIQENLSTFKGRPVEDWTGKAKPEDFASKGFRVRIDYEQASKGVTFAQQLAGLLNSQGVDQIESLVIGGWQGDDTSTDTSAIVEALVAARPKLPRLRNLFLGDIMMEECEISWIQQSDLSPLLNEYDQLEHLTVRGGEGLSFGTLRHDRLRELIVQTGGLPPSVVHEIGAAQLPALEHLELWLGEPNYGGEATVEDLAPLLQADRFPRLKYLGLKDSIIADEIAGVVAIAPVLDQLETLDLSMGTLSDEGAQALLNGPRVRKLKRLDLHHHFISPKLMVAFNTLGIEVDLSDRQEPDDWGGEQHRFIAVSE